jgi:pyridoxal phosphate enzyme (YggS family)
MIDRNVQSMLAGLPTGTLLLAAAKGRSPQEVLAAVEAGITAIGENYLQDAETAYPLIGPRVQWHFIGTLQKNKARAAVRLFDMIETVDSLAIAQLIDKESARISKVVPVLVEVNSGRELNKSGVMPEQAEQLIRQMANLHHLRVMGLMTMGPHVGEPEQLRPYFRDTRSLFNYLKRLDLPDINMTYISMGMTGSYQVALAEGANIIRIGSKIFGPR